MILSSNLAAPGRLLPAVALTLLASLAIDWVVVAGAAAEPPEYRSLIEEAVREHSAGNFREARALFLAAHRAYPNARTHRGLGLVEFELRNYAECIRQLEAALASKVRPLDQELRAKTQRLLTRANRFVARVVVQAEPAASAVLVDGESVDGLSERAFLVGLGEHVVTVQTGDGRQARRRLTVEGGERKTLPFKLGEEDQTASPQEQAGGEQTELNEDSERALEQLGAFTREQVSIGGGIRYATSDFGVTVGARGGYTFAPGIYAGAAFDYGFGEAGLDYSVWMLTAEGGYDFGVIDALVLRPVLALGLVGASAEVCFGEICESASESDVQLGIGGQALYAIDALTLGAEVRGFFLGFETFFAGVNVGAVF